MDRCWPLKLDWLKTTRGQNYREESTRIFAIFEGKIFGWEGVCSFYHVPPYKGHTSIPHRVEMLITWGCIVFFKINHHRKIQMYKHSTLVGVLGSSLNCQTNVHEFKPCRMLIYFQIVSKYVLKKEERTPALLDGVFLRQLGWLVEKISTWTINQWASSS